MVLVATQTIVTNLLVCTGAAAVICALWHRVRLKQPVPPVLIFEKIGTPPKNSALKHTWTTPEKLEKTLLKLRKKGYIFLRPQETATVGKKAVLLAFMGGYRSFYKHVFALLEKHQIPAIILLAPDSIGTYNSWQDPYQEPWQDLLTQEEINELKKSPLIYWGALPLNGQQITGCTPKQAAFFVKESIYRLLHQQNIAPVCWSNYPTRTLPPQRLAALKEQGIELPFIEFR